MTDKTQEPVAWINWCAATGKRSVSFECESELASQPLYEGITQNTQYHYSKFHSWFDSELHRQKYTQDHPAYLAAQEAWNAANDAAQHRINRLNADIEAWKVRFKIAEDALVKLNGPEQKAAQQQEPVAWTSWRELAGARHYDTPGWEMYANKRNIDDVPLYTSPQPAQPSKPWVGLSTIELDEIDAPIRERGHATIAEIYRAIEAKLREKNA